MTKERLVYIDFMKGLCILLILAFHIDNDIFPWRLNFSLQAFRIPLYYFLSGIFFKQYSGFLDFARRKTNNILVPYIFFFLLTCFLQFIFVEIINLKGVGTWEYDSLLDWAQRRYYHYNTPLWFLISLFELNIIYYVLQKITSDKRLFLYPIILVLSLSTYFYHNLSFLKSPLYLDTALLALPYFVLGHEIKLNGLLQKSKYDWVGFIIIIPVAIFLYFYSRKINLLMQILPNLYRLYLLPFIAIISLFWFSKNMPRIPILTYIGRYSIIVLGTHIIVIKVVKAFLTWSFGAVQISANSMIFNWIIFAITVALELLIIPFMVRFAPYVTAQKEPIRPFSKGNK